MIKIPPQKPFNKLSALVIDGQSLVHDSIQLALADIGVRICKSAENAYYALRLCEETKFDVILISFDIKSDKDGFALLEEMKLKGYITKTTMVIFLSADTSMELVNCVVELQPSDFWVKPLDRKKMEQRFTYLFGIKEKLYKLAYCIDKQEYPTAIYYAERQLLDPSLKKYYPMIHRLIGECLFSLMEYAQAETFYKKLSQQYKYGWVQVALVRSLLKQDKMAEAVPLADELLERDDTRFNTYDALAEYYIEKENYEKGYEIIQEATKLAPRNLDRNKKSWNLARLNHDKKGQYVATMNMAKHAKNSIHDSPDLTLNVIRSAIDLAASMNGEEANRLMAKAERDISVFAKTHGSDSQTKEKLAVIDARILNLKSDKKGAEEIIQDYMGTQTTSSIEDGLDKVKAFHEMGYWEESIKLLDNIKIKIEGDSFLGQVLNEYLEQETKERGDIHYSPKELNEMASAHFKNKRYEPAFEMLSQAFILTPKNPNMALGVLKVLAKLVEEVQLNEVHISSLAKCRELLDSTALSPSQQKKVTEFLSVIEPRLEQSA